MPFVRVSMTDRDVVERVANALRRGVVTLRKRRPHHRKPFATAIRGAPAVQLMIAVRPFLSKARQSQIDRAIASWHGRPPRWSKPAAECSAAGCGRRGSVRGLCARHYEQWRRGPRESGARIKPVEAPSDDFHPTDCTCDDDCVVSWLSGLLEGEGTFGTTRRPSRAYPVLSVEMGDQDIVARAARILGAAAVRSREPKQRGWNATYITRITGDRAAEWMRRVRDNMGSRRSAAINAALAAYQPIRLTEPPTKCVVPGCERPHRSQGLCNTHYMGWSRDRAKGRVPRITPLR